MVNEVVATENSHLALEVVGLRRWVSSPSLGKKLNATKTTTKELYILPTLEEEGSLPERCMMLSGQSLSKKPRERMNLLMLGKISWLGTWNVRTLYQTGKLKKVTREFNAYKLDTMEIRETRWTGNGRSTLGTGETILYSHHEEEDVNHTEGVGLILFRQATKSLLGWQPEGSRIA
ncbi:endonuclease-reverse transcriptase [Elysia marginata]|uniref:Endonuclease-reverse transcriptase n=1 Tax=Elysia marginata TaxID=1093978 RepID=A0AAV4EU84_9GAST|nr:endonuclease-reverse transcriptase [Elysia marginata]